MPLFIFQPQCTVLGVANNFDDFGDFDDFKDFDNLDDFDKFDNSLNLK